MQPFVLASAVAVVLGLVITYLEVDDVSVVGCTFPTVCPKCGLLYYRRKARYKIIG